MFRKIGTMSKRISVPDCPLQYQRSVGLVAGCCKALFLKNWIAVWIEKSCRFEAVYCQSNTGLSWYQLKDTKTDYKSILRRPNIVRRDLHSMKKAIGKLS